MGRSIGGGAKSVNEGLERQVRVEMDMTRPYDSQMYRVPYRTGVVQKRVEKLGEYGDVLQMCCCRGYRADSWVSSSRGVKGLGREGGERGGEGGKMRREARRDGSIWASASGGAVVTNAATTNFKVNQWGLIGRG